MTLDANLLTGLGCALATFLSAVGSSIATGHASIYAINARHNGSISSYIKAFVPVIIAGVLAIYGLIISYFLVGKFDADLTVMDGVKYLAAGLSVGLAGLASGWGMSIFLKQLNSKVSSGNVIGQTPIIPSKTNSETYNSVNAPLISTSNGSSTSLDINSDEAFRKMLFAMVFLEAIGLYGHIVALFLISSS